MFAYPKQDVMAGTVVFLVALPLCLGIAIACGVPPISGLIAGIAGGLIVPWISRSPLSVTGPAAGLTAIVLTEVARLGSLEAFLTAVLLAGVLQIAFGLLRTGRFSALVPSSVIKGMLAAIGILIVWKQIPVAVGVDGGLTDIAGNMHIGAIIIAAISLLLLYGIKFTPIGKITFLPPALLVVVLSSVVAALLKSSGNLALTASQYVQVPLGGFAELAGALPRPDLSVIAQPAVWMAAVTIAIVASIETLLSVQAVDRIDPLKRTSPPDRELLAQGSANVVSGLFGGLPVTAVIVRSGANVAAGGRERLSALFHGVLLIVAVIFAGNLLNMIPLAALAAVLIQVGLNLCKPALFTQQYKLGATQYLPFAITIVAVLGLDLLRGVIVGIISGVVFVLYQNARGAVTTARDSDGAITVRFRRDGTFVSKPGIVSTLQSIPEGEHVVIDGTGEYIDHDVKEVLATFVDEAPRRRISVSVRGVELPATVGSGH